MKKFLMQAALTLSLATIGLGNAWAEKVQVLMQTSQGDIKLELNKAKAPGTVENFVQYANDGFFDGTIYHRVIPGFMIQGGGFTPDMKKKATRAAIKNEAKNGLKNKRGSIAMARTSAPHSATAQFFINHTDNGSLDYPSRDGWGYAVFGEVVEGMEVVDAIAAQPTGRKNGMQNVPINTVMIEKITVISATPAAPSAGEAAATPTAPEAPAAPTSLTN